MKLSRFPIVLFALFALWGCGESDDPTRPNTFTPITGIEISATLTTLAQDTSTPLRAFGNFSGLFDREVTNEVRWSSLDETVATVSNTPSTQGRVTAVSPGEATIRAEKDGISAEIQMTVTDAIVTTLALGPAEPSVPRGSRLQLEAQGTFSDGSIQDLTFDVLWESLTPSIATVSNEPATKGRVLGVSPGTADIQATFGDVSEILIVTVVGAELETLQVRPGNTTLANLSLVPFTVHGTFSDGETRELTADVTWTSNNQAVARVSDVEDDKGWVTTLAAGSAVITASLGEVSASSNLSVVGAVPAALSVAPFQFLLAADTSRQLTATASGVDVTRLATWSSSNPEIATVSNLRDQRGLVSARSPGIVEITATLGEVSNSALLEVTNAQLTGLEILPIVAEVVIPRRTSLMLEVRGLFSDNSIQELTRDATWDSSDPAIAGVENSPPDKGRVEGLEVGTAQITAMFGTQSDSRTVRVTDNPLTSLTITPNLTNLIAGRRLAYSATGTFADGSTRNLTRDVRWSSSSLELAVISNSAGSQGEAIGLAPGAMTISALLGDHEATAELTVIAP
jgi:trimeric autotransporter adhesin